MSLNDNYIKLKKKLFKVTQDVKPLYFILKCLKELA